MILLNILWPTFALVLLVFAVWATLVVKRVGHLRRVPPDAANFANRTTAAAYFAPVELPADNLANLFEMPVLYLALVPLLLFTRSADLVEVTLAWFYIAARAIHSWCHVRGRVLPRFRAYLVSNALLSAMWIGFFVDMVAASIQYRHAMAAMGSI